MCSALFICVSVKRFVLFAVDADVKPGDEQLYVEKLRACMDEGFGYPSQASKLFDFLYIGGKDDATDLQLISELGITHIINCASGYCSSHVTFARFAAKTAFFDPDFCLCSDSCCSNDSSNYASCITNVHCSVILYIVI